MEHIIITDLGDGYKRLVAEKGYRLFNKSTQKYYSEAVVKDISNFTSVKVQNVTHNS